MKISNLSKALLAFLIISWIFGAFTMNRAYKDAKNREEVYKTELTRIYDAENARLRHVADSALQRADSLLSANYAINLRVKARDKRIEDLNVKLKSVPTRYNSMRADSVKLLLEQRARRTTP